jgi:alkylation response protein AidB-like acyl-CoA dehydrogenase
LEQIMSDYRAPLRDMQFVLNELVGLDAVSGLPGCTEVTAELVGQVLEENARFSEKVLAPLNHSGDVEGATWHDGSVSTPAGFKQAYEQFVAGGWNALQFPSEYGGQGLPKIVATPVMEMWKSANMAFSLCPLLTAGAVEAILLTGSDQLKQAYLPKMIEGIWSGTMNLTEPQAGSDLALLRSRADRASDTVWGDHYRIRGQKIFITYGEQDLTENIIHLVLARTPDAPEGIKGISLFIVPKFMVNADGSLGKRNDVRCASIEHKLGIHASPTAVMVYGGNEGEVGEGAIGYLLGEENRGLEYMFIMMNAARFAVGLEGLAISERAYQQALAYAKERVQGRDVAGSPAAVAIIRHPDVRRMLMSMKSQVEAMRALAYVVAASTDIAHRHPDESERRRHQAFVEFMIPVVKGWSTENSIDVASTGIQIHGGTGFIEQTGAAQYLRDARITAIYEGTTAIQANDLIGRKIARDGGAVSRAVIAMMRADEAALGKAAAVDQSGTGHLAAIREHFSAALSAYAECVDWIATNYKEDIRAVHAGSVPFLKLSGIVLGGWQMARAALIAQQRLASDGGAQDKGFYEAKMVTARFFADHLLVQVPGLGHGTMHGAAGTLGLENDQFQ